jgi:hypothetical protein
MVGGSEGHESKSARNWHRRKARRVDGTLALDIVYAINQVHNMNLVYTIN